MPDSRWFHPLWSTRGGILSTVFEVPPVRGLPPLHRYVAYLTPPDGGLAGAAPRGFWTGSGTATEPDRALLRCIGEAVERHAIAGFREVASVPRSHRAFDPTEVVEFAPASGMGFDRRAEHRWVPAIELSSGAAVQVPAAAVFLLHPELRVGATFPVSSSGAAAGPTLERATCSALLEVIERDAIMTAWHLSPERPSALALRGPRSAAFLARHESYVSNPETEVRFFALPSRTTVPVVLAVARARRAGTLYVGAAAGFDLDVVLEKAMVEALTTLAVCFGSGRPRERSGIKTFDDHALHYHSTTRAPELEAFFSNTTTRDADAFFAPVSPEQTLTELKARLASSVSQVFVAPIDSPSARTLGWSVVRAVTPELIPHALEVSWLPTRRRVRGTWESVELHRREPHPFP